MSSEELIFDDFPEDDDIVEIEDIYQYHGAEYDELPIIEFKDDVEEEQSNYRLTLFFALLLAIIGAIVLGFLAPTTFNESSNEIIWWAPLIGGFVGAVIGGTIGLVVDSLLYGRKKDHHQTPQQQ